MFVRSFLLAVCFLMAAGSAGAAWLETGLCVCDNEYTQEYPSIASDGAGGLIVVWTDWRGTSRDIYAQRVTAGGELLWGAGGVPVCTVEGNQQFPVAVADGAGGAIVCWADNRSGSATEDIDLFVQRLGPEGNTRWGERAVVLCGAAHAAMGICGVHDGAGGAIFAWSDYRHLAVSQSDLYAQRIDTSGVCRWAPDGLPVCTIPGYQGWPGMASDGAGGVTLSWCDQRSGPHGTCMQRIAADGTMAFPANGIELFPLDGDECGWIVPFSGDTVAAWIMHYTPTDTLLLAQLVDADGGEVWPSPVPIVSEPDINSRVVVETGGDLVVAWTAPGLGGYDVFAQRIGPDGAVRWPAGGVPVCTAAGEQRLFLHLFADGEGGALLAWQDKRNGRLDIYAQRLDADGAPLWATDGVCACTADCDKDFPTAIADGTGGLLTAWQAPAGVYTDIFAGRVFANGGITAVLLAGFDASLREGAVVIRWTLSEAAPEARFVVSRSAGEAYRALPAGGLEGSGRRFSYVDGGIEPGTTCRWRVESIEDDERRVLFETAPLLIPAAPLALHQNRPNPFNPSTTIAFDLPVRAEARLAIYDAAGRLVRRLAAGELSAGRHEVRWDGLDDAGRPVASGVYFCRLRAGKETRSIRLVLLR